MRWDPADAAVIELCRRLDDVPLALELAADRRRPRHGSSGPTLDLANQTGDARLITLIEAFLAVADLASGQHDDVHEAVTRLDGAASADGYDRFILHWTGWMLGLAERDVTTARRWMGLQQEYLDRTGIVETWITSFSTAMCDVIDGSDVRSILARTLDLADREGYQADADCALVIAYAEICQGRFDAAAELIGTAMHGRFNATAHYVLYRTVFDRLLRGQLDTDAIADAVRRGRERTAVAALAEYGIIRPAGVRAVPDRTTERRATERRESID
ncbi:MAG TPA: hypothetical protein VFV63_10215 [Ilumatobacteraceae bacterium]|nr:hypothetical protein [Ilumatobacteraceae bacterium]